MMPIESTSGVDFSSKQINLFSINRFPNIFSQGFQLCIYVLLLIQIEGI